MRNFGNGTLECRDGYLRLYVETGRFAKKKELVKEIPLIEAENVSLEEKELNVDWKDSTQRFVFENANQAKSIFENANNFLNQAKTQSNDTIKAYEPSPQPAQESVPEPEAHQTPITITEEAKASPKMPESESQTAETATAKPEVLEQTEITTPETEAPVRSQISAPAQVPAPEPDLKAKEIAAPPSPQKEEHDVASTLTAVYPFVDSLFDFLMKLHGKVDWNIMENNVKNMDEEAKLIDQVLTRAKLDISPLVEATKLSNAFAASKEAYKILISLNDALDGLASTNRDSPQTRIQYAVAKDILSSYYVLNDIMLAIVVGDPTMNEETNQLVAMLDNINTATNFQVGTEAVVDALNRVQTETGSQESIAQCRALFKNQLE